MQREHDTWAVAEARARFSPRYFAVSFLLDTNVIWAHACSGIGKRP